jgi:hypothetical protein
VTIDTIRRKKVASRSVLNITGDAVLDVFIGWAFLYFLVSIVCSAINEGIASAFNLRGKDLEKGIRNLARGHRRGERFLQSLASSSSVYEQEVSWRRSHLGRAFRDKKPSYIPSRVFGFTVLDTLAPPSDATRSADLFARVQGRRERHYQSHCRGLFRGALDEAEGNVDRLREALDDRSTKSWIA